MIVLLLKVSRKIHELGRIGPHTELSHSQCVKRVPASAALCPHKTQDLGGLGGAAARQDYALRP